VATGTKVESSHRDVVNFDPGRMTILLLWPLPSHPADWRVDGTRTFLVCPTSRMDPFFRYPAEPINEGGVCAICHRDLDPFVEDGEDAYSILGCGHIFHYGCVMRWRDIQMERGAQHPAGDDAPRSHNHQQGLTGTWDRMRHNRVRRGGMEEYDMIFWCPMCNRKTWIHCRHPVVRRPPPPPPPGGGAGGARNPVLRGALKRFRDGEQRPPPVGRFDPRDRRYA